MVMIQAEFDQYFADPAEEVSKKDFYYQVLTEVHEIYGPRTGEILSEFCQGYTLPEIARRHTRSVAWASKQISGLLDAVTNRYGYKEEFKMPAIHRSSEEKD